MIKYIEQLLQGQPVVWKPLGEVAEIQKGKQLNKTELTEVGRYPAYNGGVSYSGFTDTYNYPANTIIISQGGASAGYVNFVETEFYANAHCYVVLPNEEALSRRFAYHYLKMKQGELMGRQIGAGIPGLSTKVLLALPIPLPPLSVQAEIVRILDSFTSLTAELEAELEARRAQYAHYRDELLDFTREGRGAVVYRPLGEVASYSDERVDASLIDTHSYVGVDNLLQDRGGKGPSSYLPEKGRLTSYSPDDILIGNIRPYLKKIWLADNEGGASGDVLVIRVREAALIPRYLYYVLASDLFFAYAMQYSKGAKMPRGSKTRIMLYPIPIPPLEEQERIVRLLDEFDTLTSSLTEGLPREIELRRQQYAYYRDQLLSFPRRDDAS